MHVQTIICFFGVRTTIWPMQYMQDVEMAWARCNGKIGKEKRKLSSRTYIICCWCRDNKNCLWRTRWHSICDSMKVLVLKKELEGIQWTLEHKRHLMRRIISMQTWDYLYQLTVLNRLNMGSHRIWSLILVMYNLSHECLWRNFTSSCRCWFRVLSLRVTTSTFTCDIDQWVERIWTDINMYDAYSGSTFCKRPALLWIFSDFYAYAMPSWSPKRLMGASRIVRIRLIVNLLVPTVVFVIWTLMFFTSWS